MDRRSRAASAVAIVGLAAIDVALSLCLFPPSEWRSPLPALTDDYAHRFYFASLRLGFLREHAALWGYDPMHMAGYPHSPLFPPLNVLYEFLLGLVPFVPGIVAYKAIVLAPPVLAPALAALAAAYGRAGRWVAPLAAAVCLPVFWAWIPVSMYLSGALCFVLSCFLAPVVLAGLARALVAPSARNGVALFALFAGSVFVHPVVVLVLAVPAAVLFAAGLREGHQRARKLLGLAALVPATLLVNWIWISACLRLRGTYTGWGAEVAGIFDGRFSLAWLSGRRGLVLYGLLFLAMTAWVGRGRNEGGAGGAPRDAPLVRALMAGQLAGAVLLLVLSVAGYSMGPFVRSEPYRFIVGAAALLVLPAAWGLAGLLGSPSRPIAWRGTAAALGIAATAFLPFLRASGKPALRATLPPEGERMLEWIRTSTGSEGRLLLEDSGWEHLGAGWRANLFRPGHHWFGTHLPALLPLITGREIVGGPFPGHFLVHQFTGFWGGELFGKRVGEYTPEELESYLKLYNAHWAVVWSAGAKDLFNRCSSLLDRTGEIGEFSTYRVREPGTFFLKGRGRVEASWERIRLSGLVPEGGEIVLSYHWWERLVANPAARLEPESRLRDPVPFIRIPDPPADLEIVTDYGWGSGRQPPASSASSR